MEISFFIAAGGGRYSPEDCGRAGIMYDMVQSPVINGTLYAPEIKNLSDSELPLESWGAILTGFDNDGADWRMFCDMGACGWCGVKRLSYLENDPRMGVIDEQKAGASDPERSGPYHRSDMQTVLWDNANKTAVMIGFTLQWKGNNHIRVYPDPAGAAVVSVMAVQQIGKRLAPGETFKPDCLVIAAGPDPYKLLEDYSCIVQTAHGKTFDSTPIVGMMTWYGYHTAVTEAVVQENAIIMGEIFNGYPQPMRPVMLIDHGWQVDACWGDFRVDTVRFPHGLKWLSNETAGSGVELGLWHTPFCVSWNAPNRDDLTGIMRRGDNGELIESYACVWGALPGHKSGNLPIWFLDGGRNEVQERWISEFQQLNDWGAVYVKIDFFALGADASHGVSSGDLYTKTWNNFRRGAGEGMHLAPCSCMTNMQAGYCDSIRIGSDIGMAGRWPGAAEHFIYGHSTLGALWYKNRKFWINDGDSVQVGRGCSLNEARLRLTTVAFTGGHFMLSEDFRFIDATRIEMVRRMLPALPKAAVPINMFEQPFPDSYADIWALAVDTGAGPGVSLALFNLTSENREMKIKPEMFGFEPGQPFTVIEWWQSRWLGTYTGDFPVIVPTEDVYILHAAPVTGQPALFSTSHHFAGSYILDNLSFNAETGELSGEVATKPGINLVLFGLSGGWELKAQEAHHATTNSAGGFQKELTTTSQHTPFTVSFC